MGDSEGRLTACAYFWASSRHGGAASAARRRPARLALVTCFLGLLLVTTQVNAAPPSSPPVSPNRVRREVDALVERARALELSQHVMWWRLLHYVSGPFGPVSEADGAPFSNSPDGKTDPEAELEATLRAFFGPEPSDRNLQHPFCRFPARLAWLAARLDIDFTRLPKHLCPALEDYREKTRTQSLTLVFSSYFLNTPASAFGHSFLRLNKRPKPGENQRQELLDYGIDYSASVDTDNALIYAVKGLTGLFPGHFSKRPYYFKVREYNDFEARDLWELDLSLTQAEVDMAVAHIWELGSTYFDYYYLTENCSYHMLGILEVARPSLDLRGRLGWPVVPIDTVRAITKSPGLVRRISYRPSVRSQFRYGLSRLSPEETDAVFELGENVEAPLPSYFTREQQVRVLDVALDLIDVRYADELLDIHSEGSRLRQKLSSRRAATGVVSNPRQIPPPSSGHPASGHGTRRLSLGPGWASDAGFYHSAKFRLALHDMSDPSGGYPNELAIGFLPTELRVRVEEQSVTFENFSLIEVQSFTPRDRFDEALSWNFRLGGTRLRDSGCDDCFAGLIEVGGGRAFALWDSKLTFFLHLDNRVVGLAPIEGGIADLPLRAGLGPFGGLRLAPNADWTLLVTGDAIYLPTQTPRVMWSGRGTLRAQYYPGFTVSAEGTVQPEGFSTELLSSIYY